MKTYPVLIRNQVYLDLYEIASFIISKNSYSLAKSYMLMLYNEIKSLSYLADFIPFAKWSYILARYPNCKSLITKNKKWNIIFRIENNFVVVEKIISSKLISH
jgi:hypothetical protein